MTREEKRAWTMLVTGVVAYGAYVIVIISRADGGALPEVPYAGALLWTVGGAILANIAADIAIGVAGPRASHAKDVRDKEIARLGEHVGQSFVVIGAVSAMLMALAEWDWFWIANVIYLCFVLSAVLGSLTKVLVYRGSLPQW